MNKSSTTPSVFHKHKCESPKNCQACIKRVSGCLEQSEHRNKLYRNNQRDYDQVINELKDLGSSSKNKNRLLLQVVTLMECIMRVAIKVGVVLVVPLKSFVELYKTTRTRDDIEKKSIVEKLQSNKMIQYNGKPHLKEILAIKKTDNEVANEFKCFVWRLPFLTQLDVSLLRGRIPTPLFRGRNKRHPQEEDLPQTKRQRIVKSTNQQGLPNKDKPLTFFTSHTVDTTLSHFFTDNATTEFVDDTSVVGKQLTNNTTVQTCASLQTHTSSCLINPPGLPFKNGNDNYVATTNNETLQMHSISSSCAVDEHMDINSNIRTIERGMPYIHKNKENELYSEDENELYSEDVDDFIHSDMENELSRKDVKDFNHLGETENDIFPFCLDVSIPDLFPMKNFCTEQHLQLK